MAQGAARGLYTGDEVVRLLNDEDFEDDDFDDGLDEVFFPGSDDELGFLEEEIEADEEYVSLYVSRILTCIIKFFLLFVVMIRVMVMTPQAQTGSNELLCSRQNSIILHFTIVTWITTMNHKPDQELELLQRRIGKT